MTENKRFKLTNPKNSFQEMKCGIDDRGNTLTFNEVVDMLNAFNNKNKQLKLICKDHKNHADDFKADCIRLEEKNKQLEEEIKDLNDILARYEEKELKE